jgi:hypothetical protein
LWLANARRLGRQFKSIDNKNIFMGEIHHKIPDNNEKRKVVPVKFRVT